MRQVNDHTGSLIVFDGDCVLCCSCFRFVLRHDRAERFSFALAQSPLGQRLYRAEGLAGDDLGTMLVVAEGRVLQRLDAVAAVLRGLGGPWRLLALCRFLPRRVKDALYGLIARNRFRLFGRRDACLLPPPDLALRFAPEGLAGSDGLGSVGR
ncbi:thiol-disulfide oxidoreductase DCC family protein [Cribrihabitans neustonicus]|uniref:thiol-disulfide oxidoreductase DCC family protein n=1 Tax=Cribrihabitans neustonicus TaxID=1429085 RepID=UPI003B593215